MMYRISAYGTVYIKAESKEEAIKKVCNKSFVKLQIKEDCTN